MNSSAKVLYAGMVCCVGVGAWHQGARIRAEAIPGAGPERASQARAVAR